MATKKYIDYSVSVVKKMKLGRSGDFIIMISGLENVAGGTNTIQVHRVE